jgi:hypothetical protein
MRTTFYTYFSSCYGTIWLALLAFSLLTQSRINTGEIGLIGFPIIAAIYAGYRRAEDADRLSEGSQK